MTIQWVGDTVLASAFGTPPNGGRDSLDGVARSLRLANLTWGNFEETFSVGGDSKCSSSSTNCFAFQAPPSFARNLTAAGFDLVNLANNHAYDFGASGFAQTHAALKRAHLRWAEAAARSRSCAATARGLLSSASPPTRGRPT